MSEVRDNLNAKPYLIITVVNKKNK